MLETLSREFGDAAVRASDDARFVAIVRPSDLASASALVRIARAHSHQVVPIGSGTKRDWEGPSAGPTIEMDTKGLSRIVAYEPADMTVEVEAGITLAKLTQELVKNGHRLTLDPPHTDRATVGGVLATNDSGPIRLGFGTARDVTIGMSMIEQDGVIIRSGGRVVKNVAGYDLHKLYIGSFGTLGPIATVTFKLSPVAEAQGLVVIRPLDAADAERIIGSILAGETRPTMIELLNARAASAIERDGCLTLVIGFEENADAVRWQCRRVGDAFGGDVLTEVDSPALYHRLRELAGAPAEVSFKATLLSSAVATFVERASRWPTRLIARAGNGIVYGLLDDAIEDSAWRELEEAAVAGQGNLQVRGSVPVLANRFGRHRADAYLSVAIQKGFDPDATFAPERLT